MRTQCAKESRDSNSYLSDRRTNSVCCCQLWVWSCLSYGLLGLDFVGFNCLCLESIDSILWLFLLPWTLLAWGDEVESLLLVWTDELLSVLEGDEVLISRQVDLILPLLCGEDELLVLWWEEALHWLLDEDDELLPGLHPCFMKASLASICRIRVSALKNLKRFIWVHSSQQIYIKWSNLTLITCLCLGPLLDLGQYYLWPMNSRSLVKYAMQNKYHKCSSPYQI